jgi:hypothetical protein
MKFVIFKETKNIINKKSESFINNYKKPNCVNVNIHHK